jgi:hypothetical protein
VTEPSAGVDTSLLPYFLPALLPSCGGTQSLVCHGVLLLLRVGSCSPTRSTPGPIRLSNEHGPIPGPTPSSAGGQGDELLRLITGKRARFVRRGWRGSNPRRPLARAGVCRLRPLGQRGHAGERISRLHRHRSSLAASTIAVLAHSSRGTIRAKAPWV